MPSWTPTYNYSGAQPYAGPNRSMDGDPAFEAWRQRQFSSQPFSGPNDPMFKMPTSRGDTSKPWNDVAGWDPRQILQGPAYQGLLDIGQKGSGGPANARRDTAPAMDWMKQSLASGDPLGTAQYPQIQEQRGFAALRDAGRTANRQIDESSGGMNAMSDPRMAQFMKTLSGFGQAGGMGDVARMGTESRIQERSATAAFQQAVADAMSSLGLNLGGMDIADAGVKTGAFGQAGQLESFARNIFATIMGQLLQQQNRGYSPAGSSHQGGSDYNPFPSPGDYGTFTGSNQTNPFQMLQQEWLAGLGRN